MEILCTAKIKSAQDAVREVVRLFTPALFGLRIGREPVVVRTEFAYQPYWLLRFKLEQAGGQPVASPMCPTGDLGAIVEATKSYVAFLDDPHFRLGTIKIESGTEIKEPLVNSEEAEKRARSFLENRVIRRALLRGATLRLLNAKLFYRPAWTFILTKGNRTWPRRVYADAYSVSTVRGMRRPV